MDHTAQVGGIETGKNPLRAKVIALRDVSSQLGIKEMRVFRHLKVDLGNKLFRKELLWLVNMLSLHGPAIPLQIDGLQLFREPWWVSG